MKTARQMNRFGTIALAGLLVFTSQAVPAADPDGQRPQALSTTYDVRGIEINIQDIDLSTPSGARWLYRQIVSSAKAICWKPIELRNGVQSFSAQVDDARRCFDESVNSALARVRDETGRDIERLAALDRYDEAGLVASVSE